MRLATVAVVAMLNPKAIVPVSAVQHLAGAQLERPRRIRAKKTGPGR